MHGVLLAIKSNEQAHEREDLQGAGAVCAPQTHRYYGTQTA